MDRMPRLNKISYKMPLTPSEEMFLVYIFRQYQDAESRGLSRASININHHNSRLVNQLVGRKIERIEEDSDAGSN